MLQAYQSAIANQFEAAYCTLKLLVDGCSQPQWDAPVAELKFCQVMFHTLFFSDVYLGPNLAALRQQEFHQQHQEFFGDYEELEDRAPQMLYSKADIQEYLQHCRGKAQRVIAAETESSLATTPGFDWLDFSRAEVHVYNLRHLFHHAGQLSLRQRIDIGEGVKWIHSGWSE